MSGTDGDGIFDVSGSFIYDGGQIVLELDDTGAVEPRLLWGPNVDQILADESDNGDVHWALTDHLNTVRGGRQLPLGRGQVEDIAGFTCFQGYQIAAAEFMQTREF